jgi:hypothetical protein
MSAAVENLNTAAAFPRTGLAGSLGVHLHRLGVPVNLAWTGHASIYGVDAGWSGNAGPHATPESGAGDAVIVSITGHVSYAILPRYRRVRMEPKRRALDEIAAR